MWHVFRCWFSGRWDNSLNSAENPGWFVGSVFLCPASVCAILEEARFQSKSIDLKRSDEKNFCRHQNNSIISITFAVI
ncbi:hypothetical protein EVA_14575 [gut metagenome]|uniref:Uncharacterized protein n=1 Tax=gut metagenome TaxID=749906 RepID=J9FS43_9ZZZZ